MNLKIDPINTNKTADSTLVQWSEKYNVDIELIDTHHKELVNLTNDLYRACMGSDGGLDITFKDTMSRMVEYVRFHFTSEMQLLERIKFPGRHIHKMQHDKLIENILDAVIEYKQGKNFVPNNFVRTLRDWILGHIAIFDKAYVSYVKEQKSKGLLSDLELVG